jgi:hypothetical protein
MVRGKPIDITGQRFGSLVAIKPTGVRSKWDGEIWECRCDCGTVKGVAIHSLKNGNTKSCGCSFKKPRPHRRKQGTGSRLYRIWSNMKTRCLNPNNQYRFSRYGGRGITVCEEWMEFEPFRKWAVSSGYTDELTIDRIDNNQGYFPENCRWVTMAEQNRNRSSAHLVTIGGVTKCVEDWKEELHADYYKVIRMEDKT